jgi:hypothetical protein
MTRAAARWFDLRFACMAHTRNPLNRRRLELLFGLLLAVLFYAQFQMGGSPEVVLSQGTPVVLAAEAIGADPFERLIRENPLEALVQARARHLREVTDYQCVMVKQEALPSGMSEEQEIEVKFRHDPYSVYMHWLRNPGLANRVIYVKDRWLDAAADSPQEQQLAVAQPGKIAQLFVRSIKQPIRGKLARKSSRRSLDEFGFEKTLDLLIKYCQIARDRNELLLEYRGTSYFDGRAVWVVRRTLPYTMEGGLYPDRTAEIYIDQAYRVPVAVYCYADDERLPRNLLGKYEYRNIRFRTGLSDRDFDPVTYGM